MMIVALAYAPVARAQPNLTVRSLGVADGLAHASVRRIVTDSAGFVWFCTDAGLSRFDGRAFVSYGAADGLAGPAVNDIVEDVTHGEYWIGTTAGLYRLERDRPPKTGRMFARVDVPVPGSIRRMLIDRRQRLWIATSEGLAVGTRDGAGERIEPMALPQEDERYALTVFALLESEDGAVWAGTQADGLYRVAPEGGGLRRFPASERGLRFIRDLREGPDGRIWCTYFGGVARLKEHPERADKVVAELLETEDGIPSSDTTDLAVDPSGVILVGTIAGIARIAPDARGVWKVAGRWTMREGLSSDAVRSLAFDPAGNLWIGTVARGAMKLVPSGLRRYPGVEESASFVVGLTPDGGDAVLALAALATGRFRLHRLTGSGSSSIDVRLPPDLHYLGWGGPRLTHAPDGAWWIATGAGLLHYGAPAAAPMSRLSMLPDRRFGPEDGLPGRDIFWVAEGRDGTVWVAVADVKPGGSSIARLPPGGRRFIAVAGKIDEVAKSWAEGPQGTVFVGLWSGKVLRIDADGRAQTVLFDPPLPEGNLTHLAFDAAGKLWILSLGAKVAADPLAETVRVASGPSVLDGTRVNCAIEDGSGRMYFGTERGVFRVSANDEPVRAFTRLDGLPGDSVMYCARGADGGLWFADVHGVSRLDPSSEPKATATPRAMLASLRVDGEAWPVPPLGTAALGPIELASGAHRIAAEFFVIDHSPGEHLSFQHQLEGRTEWSAPSDARTLEFPRLGPGRHRLLVRAVQAMGAATAPVTVDLFIPAPMWQRGWFLALVAAMAAAAATAAYRVRVGRLLDVERMRTRIASDLHDAVGADLSRISLLAEVAQHDVEAQPERTRSMLGEVAKTARDAVREMSDIVWALQSKPADLAEILGRVRDYAADVAASSGIALHTTAGGPLEDVKLSDDARRELYLLLKEAVSNAIRHSGARTLALSVEAKARVIVAEVRDDGRGFDTATPPSSRGGRGLGNMRARAARLGGTWNISSAPGRGTAVRVEIPSA